MKPLNHEARTLVDSARTVEGPSDAYRERMRARLVVGLGGAMAASTVAVNSNAAVVQTGVAKVVGTTLWVKTGMFIIGIAVLAAGVALLWPASHGVPVAVPAQQSVKVAPPDSIPKAPEVLLAPIARPPLEATGKEKIALPPALPARPRQTSALPRRMIGKTGAVASRKEDNASTDNVLNQELLLLSRAQAALSSGDADRALALLDEHANTFPNGAMREERMAARVFALCSLGRQDEAHAEAERFVSVAPRSPLSGRVRAACSSGESSPLQRP